MEDIAKILSEYGVTIVIVILFLWDWVENRKTTNKSLEEMAKANANTANSLDLLRKSSENQEKLLLEHDKRSLEILTEIKRMEGKKDG